MIETWSRGPADECMPEDIIVQTLEKVRRHPWWHARAKLALAVLQKHGVAEAASVLDVGCGWGINLQMLENAGYEVTGMDISRRILELIDRPNRRLIEADLTQPGSGTGQRYHAVLALDVIEHLDDDRAAVAALAKFLRPGGVAVVSVPALPDLFSDFDRVQGHRRRYLPETLRAAFKNTGFSEPALFWWGAWMVPVLKRMRGKQNSGKTYSDYLRVPTWPLPLAMNMAFAWEKGRALAGKLKVGTSLFAVARTS